MGTSVNSVKILIGISAVSLLLAYLVSVNMEIGYVSVARGFISGEFLFSVFSGIFASTLVVIICELHKYYDLKTRIENALYTQFAFLYGQLLMIRNNINKVLHNPNEPLTEKLLHFPAANSAAVLNNIRNLEYRTFQCKSHIGKMLGSFIADKSIKLDGFLIDCDVLDMAICEDKIELLRRGSTALVTSTSPKTHQVLLILNEQTETYINEIDSILVTMDKACNDRFQWVERRNAMFRKIRYSDFGGVKDFIDKNKVKS